MSLPPAVIQWTSPRAANWRYEDPAEYVLSPVSMMSLPRQPHIRHHLHPKKGQVSHRNKFPNTTLWHLFQVVTYSPTPSDPAYTPESGTHILEKGAVGRLETPQRPGFVHLCILHPKAHNSNGTKTNFLLYSSLENASLCPISLPYTWQTLSKSTWTGLEWNWIGTELSAEKVLLSLFSQGELLLIPSSVHPQLFLDAFVWPSPCKIAINLFPCLCSQYTMNSPNTESPCLFHFYIFRPGT